MKKKSASLSIKVVPKAHRNEIAGWENGALKVKLRAIPEKGEANEALIAFLAEAFNLAKSQITLTHGHTSRHKRLSIEGLAEEELQTLVEEELKNKRKGAKTQS